MGLDPFSGSKWNHDVKIDKRQHRNDILGVRTSSRVNHEDKKANEDARRQARKDKRAAAAAEKSGLCAAFIIGSAIGAAGLASHIARAKGWAA